MMPEGLCKTWRDGSTGERENEIQTQELQSMPRRTINSFARTNNVNPSKDAACLKRKKRDAEFTGNGT